MYHSDVSPEDGHPASLGGCRRLPSPGINAFVEAEDLEVSLLRMVVVLENLTGSSEGSLGGSGSCSPIWTPSSPNPTVSVSFYTSE